MLAWDDGVETYAEERMLVKVRAEVVELKVCILAELRLARREILKIILKEACDCK